MGKSQEIDKQAELAELVALRRREEPDERHHALHTFDGGAWDFNYVVPWTKAACNVDAKLMIVGQDWASEKSLNDPRHNTPDRKALRKQQGRDPHLPTNKNLERLLMFFDLTWEKTYATDVSVFIKRDDITAKVPMRILKYCAAKFTIPQLRIVKPLMAVCLGGDTFNSLRLALGAPRLPLREVLRSNAYLVENGTEIHGVPHPGGLGTASFGGQAGVDPIWKRLSNRFRELQQS